MLLNVTAVPQPPAIKGQGTAAACQSTWLCGINISLITQHLSERGWMIGGRVGRGVFEGGGRLTTEVYLRILKVNIFCTLILSLKHSHCFCLPSFCVKFNFFWRRCPGSQTLLFCHRFTITSVVVAALQQDPVSVKSGPKLQHFITFIGGGKWRHALEEMVVILTFTA